MSADIPNTIVPRGNDLTPAAYLEAVTTYLDKTIKDNTETMDALQTRLAKVSHHFESSLPGHARVQMDRLNMIGGDLGAISELITRLRDGSIEKEEKKSRKRIMKKKKWKKMRTERLEEKLRKENLEEKVLKGMKPEEAKLKEKVKQVKVKEEKTEQVKVKEDKVNVVKVKEERVKEVKVKEVKVKEVKVKVKKEMGNDKEKIATAHTTTATAATPTGTQLLDPPAVNLASSEHSIISNSAPLPLVVKDTTTLQISTKPDLIKTFREILQRNQGRGMLALKSAQYKLAPVPTAQEEKPAGLSGQTGLEAKEQVEVGRELENELENENQNTITSSPSVITATQTGTQIPPLPTVNHTSPGHPAIATNSTPQPITVNKTTTTATKEIMKTPQSKTRKKALEAARRRSQLIIASVQKSAQAMLAVSPTVQVDGTPSPGPPINKTTPKPKSPILKPKPGAGVTKKKAASRTPSQSPPKIKQSPQVGVDREQENQNQIQNAAAAASTTKPRRGKTRGKEQLAPQRRSTRIMESAQKKAQANLPTTQPESPILKPKDGAGVSKRGGRGGARGSRGGRGRGRGARGGRGG